MLIKNAVIHTLNNKNDIINGFILIENGLIKRIGEGAPEHPDVQTIDARGASLYPGFIDSHTHLGMWEDGLSFEGDDGNEDTDPATPHLRALDAVNPFDNCFSEAVKAGVTAVVTGPGSANPIGGQLIAMRTYGRTIDEMIIKSPAAMKMALGENPKSVYHGKNESPVTRMATAAIIRENLKKAKRYMEDIQRAEEDEDFDLPEIDFKYDALIPVLKKELSVHFHAHRRDDILTAIRIAKEFDLDYRIVHCTEGHMIADILSEESVAVMSGPFLCDRSKPELSNQTPESAGILSQNGIMTAIITDHPVIPVQYLPVCAALAVREGMSYDDAVSAITINAARICGIDDKVGSLEEGKEADIVFFRKNPLSIEAKPEKVIVRGKLVYERD